MMLMTLFLNPDNKYARNDLRSNYGMHQTLTRLYGDLPGRILFRIDADRVTVSGNGVASDMDKLPDGYLHDFVVRPNQYVDTRDTYEFKLFANPTIRYSGDARRKIYAIAGKDNQLAWLGRKAEVNGFRVLCIDQMRERRLGYDDAPTHEHKPGLPLVGVDFHGVLQVVDRALFSQALANGIGRGKAFGMGLLLL